MEGIVKSEEGVVPDATTVVDVDPVVDPVAVAPPKIEEEEGEGGGAAEVDEAGVVAISPPANDGAIEGAGGPLPAATAAVPDAGGASAEAGGIDGGGVAPSAEGASANSAPPPPPPPPDPIADPVEATVEAAEPSVPAVPAPHRPVPFAAGPLPPAEPPSDVAPHPAAPAEPPGPEPEARPEPALVDAAEPYPRVAKAIAAAAAAGALGQDDIAITDQDVLFGRGGLTNRHLGNLRYRDVISIHRQDYVRATKSEKPNVARRIVMAIRTGKNPGRFLRKGADGRWHEVSDKEAAWKASQALREKTRWSSMKEDGGKKRKAADGDLRPERRPPPTPIDVAATTVAERAARLRDAEQEAWSRAALEAGRAAFVAAEEADAALAGVRVEQRAAPPPPPRPPGGGILHPTDGSFPTEVGHIEVPPVADPGASKKEGGGTGAGATGSVYALPVSGLDPLRNSDVFPGEEDVLFGRGGRTNHHPGNKRLRQIVNKYRDAYNRARKVDKPAVSKLIVGAMRRADPPARFLRYNDGTARWEDVGDKRAAEKVSQTLREKDKEEKMRNVRRREAAREEYLATGTGEYLAGGDGRGTVAVAAADSALHGTAAAAQAMPVAKATDMEHAPLPVDGTARQEGEMAILI